MLTLTSYLSELAQRLDEIPVELDPIVQLGEGGDATRTTAWSTRRFWTAACR